jgi:2-aminoadipate transaminase
MPPAPVRFSEKAGRTTDSPISYFIQQAVENPNIISLAAGLVDPLSLPGCEVAAATAELLAQPARAQAALQYGTTHGYVPLRAKLLARAGALDGIAPQDISVDANDLVVTTGSQQLLYLVTELLLNPGDMVIAEAPSYFVYQGTLTSAGVRTLTVSIDEDGLNTDALEELLGQLERSGELDRLKLIYVVDYFQNPTGLSLSLSRRQRLVELVKRFSRKQRIFILEDAAYRELRFDGPDLPSIKSFDRDNEHVILGMTFSKPCAPGLKTGYGLMPTELVAPLLHIKGNHDFGSNNLTQHLLDRLLETGAYDRHVGKLRDVYRGKRDALLAVLDEEFADGSVRWTHPQGGLYVWLTFPQKVRTGPQSPLMKAALREGVLYVPGEFCYINGANGPIPTNEARLSFGVASAEQIREAVRRLGRAYRSVCQPDSVLAKS